MPRNPLFSIVTVTLNNANGLAKTRDSILTQTCKDYEWLVQDGASTDHSLALLTNTPVKLESAPDTGIYNAMNRTIQRSKGTYLIFMNAGDCFATPKTLKNIKTAITKNKPDFIYGDAIEDINKTQHNKPAKPHTAIKNGMFTHHQAMLYKRQSIGHLRYNEHYKIAADYDFTATFLQQNSKTLYIPEPICIFESGGISQQNAALGRKEQFQIRKNQKLCPTWQNHSIKTLQACNLALRRHCPKLYWFLKRH